LTSRILDGAQMSATFDGFAREETRYASPPAPQSVESSLGEQVQIPTSKPQIPTNSNGNSNTQ
jgi:hypothetical protein